MSMTLTHSPKSHTTHTHHKVYSKAEVKKEKGLQREQEEKMAAAAAAAPLLFRDMSEAGLRQWVEANPGRVNDRDSHFGLTPLIVAIFI